MCFDSMSFGIRIQELRMAQKMTQERLAEELGVSKEFVGKIERGQRACSFAVLIRISDVFDVSTDYLLKGREADMQMMKEQMLYMAEQLKDMAEGM